MYIFWLYNIYGIYDEVISDDFMYKEYENMSDDEFRKMYINDDVIIDFDIPKDVQTDIDALEDAIKRRDAIDCYQGELYSSINNRLNCGLSDERCRLIRRKYRIGW